MQSWFMRIDDAGTTLELRDGQAVQARALRE